MLKSKSSNLYFLMLLGFLFYILNLFFHFVDNEKLGIKLLILLSILQFLFVIYSEICFKVKRWVKIGYFRLQFEFLEFIGIIFIISTIIFIIYSALLNDNFVFTIDFLFPLIFVLFIQKRNYHLIVKRNNLSIVLNNRYEDFSPDKIKNISIENNNIILVVKKENKTYSFPFKDFNKEDLITLNKFITIENL